MKKFALLIAILVLTTACTMNSKETIVLIKTDYGNITVKLYNETPLHKANFIKLANEGFYNGLPFHRIIKDFMIQGGEQLPDSATTMQGDTIAAEFRTPLYFHKRGALAAARWGDAQNPTKASDAHQSYIVTGEKQLDYEIKNLEKQRFERLKQSIYHQLQTAENSTIKQYYKEGNKTAIAELRASIQQQADKEATARQHEALYTDLQKEIYKEIGGTPHLDGEYTVFGEVIDGMDVVAKIEDAATNTKDKPLQPIVMQVEIVK